MKNIFIRLSSFIAAAIFIFSLAACGGRNDDSFSNSQSIGKEKTYITADYTIIYESANDDARNAAERISSLVKETLGLSLKVKNDDSRKVGCEILVGEVQGRAYSYFLRRMAKKDGWKISVYDDSIYCIDNTESYEALVNSFGRYFTVSGFTEETSSENSDNYRIENAVIGDVPLGFFDIVYSEISEDALSAAEWLADWIEENVGYILPVVSRSAAENMYNILVGMVDFSEHQTEGLGFDDYSTDFNGDTVCICAPKGELIPATQSFIAHYFRTGEKNIELSLTGREINKCWEYLNTELSRKKMTASAEIAAGISYEQITLEGNRGEPVEAYLLIAESKAGWNLTVGVDPGYRQGKPVTATVLDTAENLQAAGKNVLFACNSGYFKMKDHNYPEGVLVSDGVMLSNVLGGLGEKHLSFFGILKNGEFVIGNSELLSAVRDDLQQATGGRGILLKNGKINDICYRWSDCLGEERHPRTAFGWRENGDLVFAVVDGRQPGYSVGVNLCDMALLLQSYGVVNAINLDGGGSSTFVSKDADGKLSVKNRPCNLGGSMRKVGDCLILTME